MPVHSCGDGSVLAAHAWLSRAVEPGNRALWAYVEARGPVAVAAELRDGQGPRRLQQAVGPRAAEDRSMKDLQRARSLSIRLIHPGIPEWPGEAITKMQVAAGGGSEAVVPPLALWIRGPADLATVTSHAVAIVGARASTPYGDHVAADIASDLANRTYTVLSGGAFGIDASAHRGALAVGGVTIAVLASGVDRPYPAGNETMFNRILQDGLLISEWPPGCAPMRQRFLVRNRLIAGLAAGTVVVEAALRSGARSTAARAQDLGTPVMAVPGPVTSAMSMGCLELLRSPGVIPVGTGAHVLEAVGRIGSDLTEHAVGPTTPFDDLTPEQRMVLEAVPKRRPATVESIAMVAGVRVPQAQAHLTLLELIGLVLERPTGWRRAD